MKLKMKLVNTKIETHDSKTLTFESPDRPDFKPGQFFMIEFMRQEKIPKRSYSVSSSPTRKGILEFTVKAMPNGYVSKLLNEAKVGEEFMLDGPWGHFVFESEKMPEIVLIAAGSGIAPFRCFCQYIIDNKLKTKVSLYYSNKTEADIICRHDLDEFAKKIPGMKLVYYLTREKKYGFECGHIDSNSISEIVKNNPSAYYFICGPPQMVVDVEAMLYENKISKDKVKTEKYG
jgi:ferredoxin-NADP reductase